MKRLDSRLVDDAQAWIGRRNRLDRLFEPGNGSHQLAYALHPGPQSSRLLGGARPWRLPRIQDLEYVYSPIVYPLGGAIHDWLGEQYGEWRPAMVYRELWRYDSFEDAIRAVDNVEYVRSTSRDGASEIIVKFEDDSDYDWCWNAHVGLKQTIRPDVAIKYQVAYFDHADFDIQGFAATFGVCLMF